MSLFAHHPVILIVVPLVFAALCPLIGLWRRSLCYWWALAGLAATVFCTWSLIGYVKTGVTLAYDLGDWPPPWGIRIRVDQPALLVACAVTAAVLLVMVYSSRHSGDDLEDGARPQPYSCTLMLLGTAGLLGVLMSGDIFNMLVFLQIAGVAAAGLVAASGGADAARAAFRYLVAMAASATMFLMATGLLYSVTGALDMKKISLQVEVLKQGYVPVAVVSLAVFVLALAVEAALFPASWWLPDATVVPGAPAGSMVAGMLVAVSCFAMFKVLYLVYPPGVSNIETARSVTMTTLAWLGIIAFVVAAVIAVFQDDLEHVAAYSAISQIGLVVTGIAAGSTHALAGGVLSIVSGVISIPCLLLGAGALSCGLGRVTIPDLRGVGRRRPMAAVAFTLGALSFVGVPFTVGFTGKRQIVEGLLDKGWYVPVALVFLGSVVALLYLGRIVYLLFSRGESDSAGAGCPPLAMSVSSLVLGLGTVVIGILGHTLTTYVLEAARQLL